MGDGDHGDATRQRILRAARAVLADRGLATTVDAVAEAAGVSRRTVFRAFATRDRLIAEAVRDGIRSYAEHLPPSPPPEADLDRWLAAAMRAVHSLNARHGRIYWELAGLGAELPGEIAAAAEERRQARRELVAAFTALLWAAAGGTADPPRWLADACAVQLSAFSTRALTGDFERSPEEVADACARTLAAAARAAVAAPATAG
jgi:AcrR family transcriptional regulator